ncbi:tumor necrosis factor ligand superfamily member 14-like [Aulostomus maculatus]
MLGLVIEGCFIYKLYKNTEVFSHCKFDHLCQNESSLKTSALQGDIIRGPEDSSDVHPRQPPLGQIQKKPFAHLMCSENPMGENNVVQWQNKGGDAITYLMGYKNGRLLVEQEGYYYIYSKVLLNAAEECSLIQHKVMRDTRAYDKSILLMKSKSFRCQDQGYIREKKANGDDLWESFLAGIFHLHHGDQVFVTLENIQKLRPGNPENFMGAFMISP